MKKFLTPFQIIELLIIIGLIGYIGFIKADTHERGLVRDRDVVRISNLNQIRYALDQYRDEKGVYPVCLYKTAGCTSLEGSDAMSEVPKDPLTNKPYSYAAIGHGSACTSFHLGTSLERTASQALLAGSDAPPVSASELCTGSAPDFSGLSYAPGGELCNLDAGIAQPTDEPQGETCFDLQK